MQAFGRVLDATPFVALVAELETARTALAATQQAAVRAKELFNAGDPAKPTTYVEIKNVHMSRRAGRAEFPDSITERGAKHLAELSDMVREGHRSVMIFLIQRSDVTALSLARDVDAGYGKAFDLAQSAGVEMFALRCKMTTTHIEIDKLIPIKEG